MSRDGGRWWIEMAGHPVVFATEIGRTLTRRGRAMGVRTAGGKIVSITVADGLCRWAGETRPARYVATLRIEGWILRGCYLGNPPEVRRSEE